MLIPAKEVDQFLREINTALGLALRFPENEGFCIKFYDDGTPRPRRLGITMSRNQVRELEDAITGLIIDAELQQPGNDRAWTVYREKIEQAVRITKNKKQSKNKTYGGRSMSRERE